MKCKMKQCNVCGKLSSNSAKKCHSCGSVDLAKGIFEKVGPGEEFEADKPKEDNKECLLCPTCSAPLNEYNECVFCEDKAFVIDGVVVGSFYQDYIASENND